MTSHWSHRAADRIRRLGARGMHAFAILALAAGVSVGIPSLQAQAGASGSDALPPPPPPPTSSEQAPNAAAAPSAVARLSNVEGTVEILRGTTLEFSHAVMNMPLAEGVTVRTDDSGRAEIEFEDGSVARITPNSSLVITHLTRSADGTLDTSLRQRAGLAYYELRSDPHYPFHVTFAQEAVSPTVNSTFRVDLGAAPPALAVLDGSVRVQGSGNPSGSYFVEVRQGHTIQFRPSATAPAPYTVADWIAPNGFDDWNQQLDQEAAEQAQNQTPARVQQGGGSIMDSGIGWSDLDTYGGWFPLPGYGMVWQPWGIGPGFDPYGFGMWADYGGFGYTWISAWPWGWLPFHYGMWTYIGGFGWGWLPGQYPFWGGYGYGYYGGAVGYGRYRYPYTNVFRGPRGYVAPAPPALVHGRPPVRVERVGNWAEMRSRSGARITGLRSVSGRVPRVEPHPVKFRGTKVAPLHSTMAGVRVPVRNAALYNNYPAHAFGGNVRSAIEQRTALRAGGIEAGRGGVRPLRAGPHSAVVQANEIRASEIRRSGNSMHTGEAREMERSELQHRGLLREPMTTSRRSLAINREEAMHIARGRVLAEESSPLRPGRFGSGRGGFDRQPGVTPGFTHQNRPMARPEFGRSQPAFGPRPTFGSPRGMGGRPAAFPSRQQFGGQNNRGGEFHNRGAQFGGVHSNGVRSGGGFRGGSPGGHSMGSSGGFHGGGMPSGGRSGGGGFGGGGHGR